MTLRRALSDLVPTASLLLAVGLLGACKEKDIGAGLVVDAATAPATSPDAGGGIDLMQCAGCQLTTTGAWSFEGVYRDAACTVPLAQLVAPACSNVPALGQTSLTYVDEVGKRKAGEVANVTLVEAVGPEAARFRKAGKTCVRANEGATALAPPGCAGSRVCRDATGLLTCSTGTCRTLANGCPDFEETRAYATIDDPGLEGKPAGGGGGNLARLTQCCNQLAAEAKRLGSSPEAGLLNTAASQCTALVKAAGPNGNAPELGAVRTLLANRNIPAVCSGF